ncbi:MAG: HEPN domain-containing protein, partial [Thaumarchaeota archaeon]|nr:HEPN domain-containing protein [Nitrososphaerota archaeon]
MSSPQIYHLIAVKGYLKAKNLTLLPVVILMEEEKIEELDVDAMIERQIQEDEEDAEKPAISLFHFPEDDVDRFAVTWYCRSLRLSQDFDVADRFMDLWTAFNAIYRTNRERLSEKKQLDAICNDSFWLALYESAKGEELNKFLKSLKAFETVTNMKFNSVLHIRTDTLQHIVAAIYEIRCNLFHGRKDPEDRSGRDYGLIKAAFPIMMQIPRWYLPLFPSMPFNPCISSVRRIQSTPIFIIFTRY